VAVAAPKFAPARLIGEVRSYRSPAYVPDRWEARRPGDLEGRQPTGHGFGHQGPDQGYALRLAAGFRPQLVLSDAERVDDAVAGCTAIAMRRAALYGRAPVIHDLRIAFMIWGFLDPAPDAELVSRRVRAFEGVADPHHYEELRTLVDSIPEATLRMTPQAVVETYSASWRALISR
jgi:hypothetical protein